MGNSVGSIHIINTLLGVEPERPMATPRETGASPTTSDTYQQGTMLMPTPIRGRRSERRHVPDPERRRGR